jgi:PAS domain-containing protein
MARPLELILARNLLSSLSTPAFLVDRTGEISFYNDAAGALLGRRFEEVGPMTPEQWTGSHGPFDEDGERLDWEKIELTQALRGRRPAHSRFFLHTADGTARQVEASGIPLVGLEGFHGALVVFWESGQ